MSWDGKIVKTIKRAVSCQPVEVDRCANNSGIWLPLQVGKVDSDGFNFRRVFVGSPGFITRPLSRLFGKISIRSFNWLKFFTGG